MPAWKQTTVALRPLGEGVLGFLGVEPQLGGVLRIAARIDAVGGDELLGQVVDQPLVEILAAQQHVAVGGQGAEARAVDFQDGDVEGSAAQVVDQHPQCGLAAPSDAVAGREMAVLVSVGQGRGRGLVDDVEHFQIGQPPGVLGGLAPGLVEEGGHGDHRLADRPQPPLGILLQPLQHERAEDLGRDLEAADFAAGMAAAHVPLETLDVQVGRRACSS